MKENHAYQNAEAWAGSIAEMVAALECDYERLEELRDERETLVDQSDDTSAECCEARKALKAWDAEYGEELKALEAECTIDGEKMENADQASERILNSPLSAEVRSDWHTPGDEEGGIPAEFCILLSTGGPALRIRGELDLQAEPQRAWLEYQDWGTPWTEYHGPKGEQSDLITFCQHFYFGS